MKKYLFGLIGLALLGAQPLQAGEATCGGETACNACCPHCGCRLVPVCHTYCTTKKITEYKYSCACAEICVPGITPCCKRRGSCDNSGNCADGCETGNRGCQEGCGGRCLVRDVRKLVKCPVTKEVPVRECTVEWVCPNCSKCGHCGSTEAPTTSPVAPSPVSPAPLPRTQQPLPPPPRTTYVAPLPAEIGSVQLP